jgi:hypothetical protein
MVMHTHELAAAQGFIELLILVQNLVKLTTSRGLAEVSSWREGNDVVMPKFSALRRLSMTRL